MLNLQFKTVYGQSMVEKYAFCYSTLYFIIIAFKGYSVGSSSCMVITHCKFHVVFIVLWDIKSDCLWFVIHFVYLQAEFLRFKISEIELGIILYNNRVDSKYLEYIISIIRYITIRI